MRAPEKGHPGRGEVTPGAPSRVHTAEDVATSIDGGWNTSNLMVAPSRRSRRFSPISLVQRYKLPPTKWTLLDLAASEGKAMRVEGDFDRLKMRERPVGVLVTATHRDRILKQSGASRSLWYQMLAEAVQLGLVHVCSRGQAFVLTDPASHCFNCGGEVHERRQTDDLSLSTNGNNLSTVMDKKSTFMDKLGTNRGMQ
jgi:hypothetical protein